MATKRSAILLLGGLLALPLTAQWLSSQSARMLKDHPPMQPVKPGRKPGDLALEEAAGTRRTLADFKGSPLLVNVWATWCPPCREEMPSLDRLHGNGADRLAVLPISVDDVSFEQLRAFYDARGIQNLPLYRAEMAKTFAALGVYGLPTTLLLDAEGLEVARLVGATDWQDDGVQASIRAALAKAS